MIAASFVFYGYWNWRFCFLLAASTSGTSSSAAASTRAARRPAAKRLLARGRRRQPRRCSGTSSTTTSSSSSTNNLLALAAGRPPARGALDRPARRHLVLHVPGDQLRRRRLPRRLPADGGCSTSPRSSRSSRTSSPGRSCGRASSCRSSRRARDPRHVDASARVLPDRHRPVQEGRDRELPRDAASSTACSARPTQHSSLEVLVGVYALRGPDLRRLLRLHRHRDRARAAARLPLPAELRPPVHGRVDPGLLAPLAHDAVALAARLPLHPARRQPRASRSRRTAT